MKALLLRIVVTAFLALSANTVFAAIIYDESVNGDLDAIGSTNVNLVAGVNTILGSINATPPAETDRIKFTQVAGLSVDSIVLSFLPPFDDLNIGQSMNTALFNSVANLFDDNFNMINSGASISASFFDSFGPDTGPLSQNTAGAIWDFQLSAGIVFPAQPWTLTINTTDNSAKAPEPSILVLFIAGIVGMGFARRRLRQ